MFRGDRLYHQQRNYETIDKNRNGRANQHHNGATGNMCSYTAIDEIPVVLIYHFFGTNSVTSWDFVFVVSDCGAIENLYHTHHVTSSYEETVGLALHDGLWRYCAESWNEVDIRWVSHVE